MVGYYTDSESVTHGFSYKGGKYTAFNVPKAKDTIAFGINDSGQIAGYIVTSAGVSRAFIATPVE